MPHRGFTEEERFQPMDGRCNAHREDGSYCKAFPMKNGKCHRHGGKSASGVNAGKFRNGRWTKHLPKRLAERHSQMLSDKELLSLNEEIALIDTRMADVLESVSAEDGAILWRRLKAKVKTYHRHLEARRTTQADDTLDTLFKMIEDGADEFSKWEQVIGLVDARRKVVESERKRLVEMNQMISTQEAMVLLTAILDSLKKHVTDRKAFLAVAEDIDQLVGFTTGGKA